MGEKQSYRPEDVLETEGSNKGRVKDVELAQIGAEKDQEYRESRMDEVVMKMGIAPGTNELIDSPRSTKKKEEIADSAERAGMGAMSDELHHRVKKEAESFGITDRDFIREEARKTKERFFDQHETLRKQRSEEAKEKYLKEKDQTE
ncbi:MAG: hypothetical protein PHT36_00780 [Patescibacteria group bacterium]|nr:hypothetical protein [Patescibacteria group bacterium]